VRWIGHSPPPRSGGGYSAHADTSCGAAGETWSSFTPYGIKLHAVELSAALYGISDEDSDESFDDDVFLHDPFYSGHRGRWDRSYDPYDFY
jgi:hypothetical protein